MTISSEMKADILDIVNARTVEVCIDSDVETLGEKPEEASGDSRDEVYLILGLTVDDRLTSCLECDLDSSDIVLPLFSLYTSPEGHWIVPDTNLPLHLNTDYVYSATLLTSGSTIVVGDRQLFYTIDCTGRSDEDKQADSNQVPPKPRRHNDEEDSLNTIAVTRNDDLLSHLTSPEQISNYSASLVCQQLIRLQCDFPSHEMDSLYKSFEEAVFVPFHSKLFREFIGSFFRVNDIMCGETTCFDWDQTEGYDFMRDVLSGDKDHMLQHSWDSYFQSLVVRLLTDLIREIADPVEHVILWMKILFVFTSSSFKDSCGECGQPGIVFTHIVLPLFTTMVGCLSVHAHQPFIQTLSSDILYQLISRMTMSSFIKVVRIPVVDVIVGTATHDRTDVALTRSLCRTLNCVTSSLVEFIQDGLQSASTGYSVDLEENISKLMGLLDHLALVAFPVVLDVRKRNSEDEILQLGTKMMVEFFQNSADQNRLETIQVGLIESADLEQSPDGMISNNQSELERNDPSDEEGTEDGTDAFVVVQPGSEEFIPSGVESEAKLKSTQQKMKKTGFGKIVSSFSNVFKKHKKSKLIDRSEQVTCAREGSGRDNADDRCGAVSMGSIPDRDEPSNDLHTDQSTRCRGTEVTKQDLSNGHSSDISDQSCSEILSNEMNVSNDSNENHIHSLEAPQSPPENVLLIATLSKPSKARKSGIAGAMKHYLRKMSARKSTTMLASDNESPIEIQTTSCLEGLPVGVPSRERSEQNVSSMPSTKTINVNNMTDMPGSNSCLNETIESDISPQNFDSNNNKGGGIEDRTGRKKHLERNEKLADGSEIEQLGDRVRSVRNRQRPALKQLFPICSSEICEEELINDMNGSTVPTSEDTLTEQTIGCEELSTESMSEEELKSATGQSEEKVLSYENELSSAASVLLSTKYNKSTDISSANLMTENGPESVNNDICQFPCKQTGSIPQSCSLGNEISNGGRSAILDINSKSDSEETEFDEEVAREFAFVEKVETEYFIAENNDYVQKYDILRGNDSTLIGTDEEQPEVDVKRFIRIDVSTETNYNGRTGNSISPTSKSSIDPAHQTFVETNPVVESEMSQEAFQLVEQIFQHQQPGAAEEWSIDRLDAAIKYILADISGSTGTGDHWQVLSEDIDPTIFLHVLDTIVKCRLSSECVLKLLQLLTTFLDRSPPSHLLKPACLILNNIITGSMLASFQEGWGYFSLRRIQKMTGRILQESLASSSSSLTSLNASDEAAIDAVVDTVDAVDDDTMTTVRSLNDAMNRLFASRRIS